MVRPGWFGKPGTAVWPKNSSGYLRLRDPLHGRRDSTRNPVHRPSCGGGGESADLGPVRLSARPTCAPVPDAGGTPGTAARGSGPVPVPPVPGHVPPGPVAGPRRRLASGVNFGRASRARWNEQVNTAPRAVGGPLRHLDSRCAPNTATLSLSKDSGNHRPGTGRDHPYRWMTTPHRRHLPDQKEFQ